jgi:RND family efflux transporter MFP subunit
MADEDLSKLKIDKSTSTYQPFKRRKTFYWIGIIAILFLVGLLYMTGVIMPATEVEVTTVTKVYPSQTFTILNASGYVVADRKSSVASKVTGRLISLKVEEGSRVKKGEIIARLENDDVTAARDQAEANLTASSHNLEQAEAELNDATVSFNRNKDLLKEGYISRSDYDTSLARYKKALAAVEESKSAIKANAAALKYAEAALEYTLIRAPFDAVVLTKNADVGDIVTPIGASAESKAAVVTIADMNSLQVEVDVSESNINQVKVGQPCEVLLDALPDSRFHGVVHMIVPTADRTKATVTVKIRFIDKDNRILPEMSAKVAFLSREIKSNENEPLTAIRKEAVTTRNKEKVVFRIDKDRAIKTPVSLGTELGDMIEVLKGVQLGDRVVLRPLQKIKNGSKIKVIEK